MAALLRQGVELRKAGNDSAALVAFERARAIADSPAVLAQMGLAKLALGRWEEAHGDLQRALGDGKDVWVEEHRATLEATLREITARLGLLEITCSVSGAEIRADGRLLGTAPLQAPVRLQSGRSVIQASAPGHFEISRQVDVDAGALSRVELVLTRKPSGARAQAGSGAGALNEPALLARSPGNGSGAANDPTARDVARYAAWGLATLGLAVGVTGYALRELNVAAYNDDTLCAARAGVPRDRECPSQAAAWRLGETMLAVGFSTAGALGTLGLVLSWWGDSTPPALARTTRCHLAWARIGCTGHF